MDNQDNSHKLVLDCPYAYDSKLVFAALNCSEQGLKSDEVKLRLQIYATNTLPLNPPISILKLFLLQFHNVLVYVLIFSGLISMWLRHYVDSGVIFAVVLINSLVGLIQEYKASRALQAILSMIKTTSLVVRGGEAISLDSSQIVPGDIVMLQPGDRVPADVRLFYSKGLRCDESALTGESQVVHKHTRTLAPNTPLIACENMAFMGTLVVHGTARGVVCRTGKNTVIGGINELVQETELSETPLQKQLKVFGIQLSMWIIAISVGAMLLGILLRGYQFEAMLQAAIAIAVASIPEGLPAIVTIALAIGVRQMAKDKALVRQLPGVEVLGAVDVICVDKTGTLTANSMLAQQITTSQQQFRVSGEKYSPHGEILLKQGQPLLQGQDGLLKQSCLIAVLCNDATLSRQSNDWQLNGDPTEGALLVMAMKHGLDSDQCRSFWQRVDELPFSTERRYMATLHKGRQGETLLAVKGAPHLLIQYSRYELTEKGLQPCQSQYWNNVIDSMAKQGLRVMALAQKELPRQQQLTEQVVESELVMLAVVGISDPPRAEVIESIKLCHQAGISVKMITGDNAHTASAIAAILGLKTALILTGSKIDNMSESELANILSDVDVFARTSPVNKLQLVKALQQNKHTVAMTGDGVNDAPALRQADIGVAMGDKGTDAAKEAADIVLTDDDFSTIVQAVLEGRTVYDNIVKSILFILPTSLANALVIILSIAMGTTLPVTPAQILWINMITAVTLALALAFETPEPGIMQRPPRPAEQGLITLNLLSRIILVGVLEAFIVFGLFSHYQTSGKSIELARTVVINALVLIEVVYVLNCRFLNQSIFSRTFFRGAGPIIIAILSVLVIQSGFNYLPVSQRLFSLGTLYINDWFLIITIVLPILLIVECEKLLWRLFNQSKPTDA